ncbi:MAG: hypothetical protein KDK74_10870 [Cephaloticoccus sp.]|nr:hypothetical protein [Cephaloticoccus sp.]
MDAHGPEATGRLIAFTLPAPPDESAPVFYGGLVKRFDEHGEYLLQSLANTALQAALAGSLTDRLAARRQQLAAGAAASPAALLRALHELEAYPTRELGLTLDKAQLAELRRAAMPLINDTLAAQSPDFAREFQTALGRERYTFATAPELIAAQSPAARRVLFDAYLP